MALRYAAATGNWSAVGTWDGGASIPTSADDVYANNFIVTIDQNVTVLSLRSTAGAPAIAGGHFTIASGNRSITCTGTGLVSGVASLGVIQINASTTTTTYTGTVTSGNTTNFWGIYIPITAVNANLIVIGNVVGGTSITSYAINNIAGANTITITGNITSGGSIAVRNTVAGTTVNVTGNVTGGTLVAAAGISVVGTSPVSVTGNCTAGTGPAVLTTATTSAISCVGTVTSVSNYGIDSAGTVTLSSPCVQSTTHNAVSSLSTRLLAASPITWTFKNESGTNKILYSAGVSLGNPATNDVRSGTAYGASSELTGTLAVPSPTNVVNGVATDNTTGTYTNTPALVATEIFTKLLSHSDFNTASSFGKTIKDNVPLIPAAV